MITKQDLDAAIAECLGKRDPDASTCIKLAAFYTIKEELYPRERDISLRENDFSLKERDFSFSAAVIRSTGDSEFLKAVDGKSIDDVLPVIDDLMQTIAVLYPRLYAGVINRFR